MDGLTGKVGIVTGAGSGIGRATAMKLAESGASVVVSDINLESADETVRLITEAGGAAVAQRTDIGSEEQLEATVQRAVDEFGALHLLHSNAADVSIIPRDLDVTRMDAQLWDRTFAVNLRGPLLGAKYAIPRMIEAGGGAIVTTSSATGEFGEFDRTAYSASKAAINQLTRSIATQYGKQGIRANAVAPGAVMTPTFDNAVPSEFVDMWKRNHLTPKMATPENVADVVAFLLSDLAAFITGQVLNVDGGLTIHTPLFAELIKDNAGAQHADADSSVG